MLRSILGSGGEGSDLPGYHQTTEVTLRVLQKGLGTCILINKSLSILVMLFSSRDTKTAKVEGLRLVNRSKCLVPEYPDDSPKVQMCSPFIVPSLDSTRDSHNIMIICSDLPVGKPLHMHIGTAMVHLCICQCPHQNPKYYKCATITIYTIIVALLMV